MGRNCSAGARLRVTPAEARRSGAPVASLRTPSSLNRPHRRPACRLHRDKDLIFGHL